MENINNLKQPTGNKKKTRMIKMKKFKKASLSDKIKNKQYPHCIHRGEIVYLPFETPVDKINVDIPFKDDLRKAYDEKLSKDMTFKDSSPKYTSFKLYKVLGDIILDLGGSQFKVGKAGSKSPEGTIMFSIRKKLSEIISISTSSLSFETGSSAPSMQLHQLVSTLLMSSVTGGNMVFENDEHPGKPDLTFISFNDKFKPIHIDITVPKQIMSKLDKYPDIWTLDKYMISSYLYGDSAYVSNLTELSLSNDSKDPKYITKILDAQGNPDKEYRSLYNEEILMRFTKMTDQSLMKMSNIFYNSFLEHIKKISDRDTKRFKVKDIMNYQFKDTTAWLNLINLSKMDARPLKNYPTEFKITSDRFSLSTEGETSSQFFKSSSESVIYMAEKAFNNLTSYQNKKNDNNGTIDMLYYAKAISTFSNRNPNYFLPRGNSSVKSLTIKNSKDQTDTMLYYKDPSIHKHLKQISVYQPDKIERSVYHTEDVITSDVYSEPMGLDPIDQYVLSQNFDSEALMSIVSRSKIYQILTLFRKVSDMLSLGVHDSMVSIVKHPFQDLEAHVYTSGSVTETDKGIAYVTIVSSGKPIKTFLWRSTDIRNYKVASRRLCSILSASYSKIPKQRRTRYVTLVSLLLLENSWGNSLILKPYRYLAQSFSFSSSLVNKSNQKLDKAIKDNLDMTLNKMSLSFMSSCLTGVKEANGLTPLFELPLGDAGYEFFLVNLCPPQTYGKRKHRVDMSYEIATELDLARKYFSTVSERNDDFVRLLNLWGKTSNNNYSLEIKKHLEKLDNEFDFTDSRFTYTPISLLLIYRHIRSVMSNNIFQGTCPKLSDLQTPKGSFDSYNFRNCTAMESIASLVEKHNLSTTASLSINLLSHMPLDLTYRMFDKDQVGGNREISIMPAEFRIFQSITESFAKSIGRATKIDMLDNPKKVEMLSDAQNRCTANDGIKETIDQTRWGPNFNTVLFGYMYSLMSHFTTEYYIPMLTCFLAERKVFQMPTYPELAKYQETGYTLPGLHGPFHMGQGIFHYSSSLYHTFVTMLIAEIRGDMLRSFGNINVSAFITSDDAALFTYVPSSDKRSKSEVQSIRDSIRNVISLYAKTIRFFSIKTSDYKNMVSEKSVEFNSYFLGLEVVGSNSIKFLYSLIDPVTSGNQRRDMESVMDSFTLGLNSNLSKYESYILMLARTIVMLQLWGTSSEAIMTCLQIWTKIFRKDRESLIELSARSVAVEKGGVMFSPTVLNYKTLESISNSLNKVMSVEVFQPLIELMKSKQDGLKKNKERGQGTNKAITLSKGLRSRAKMVPALQSVVSSAATSVSPAAYLANVGATGSDCNFNDPDRSIYLRPTTTLANAPKGFYAHVYKYTPETRMTMTNFLVSSYSKVSGINNQSSQEEIFLHISRRSSVAKLGNDYSQMTFAQRVEFFDNQIALNRLSGNAISLRYNSSNQRPYSSYVFPSLARSLSYTPTMELLKSNVCSMRNKRNIEYPIFNYVNTLDMKHKISCTNSQGTLLDLNQVTKETFNLKWSDMEEVAVKMIETDIKFINEETQFMNMTIMVKIIDLPSGRRTMSMSMFDQFLSFSEKIDEGTQEISFGKIGDKLMSTMSQANINIKEIIDNDKDDPDEFLNHNLDIDLVDKSKFDFSAKSYRTYTKVVSVEVPTYVNLIRQGWFKEHLSKNSLIYALIKENLILNETKIEPIEVIYSITQGDRKVHYTEPVTIFGEERALYLTSLFDIDTVTSQLFRSISFNGIAQPTSKQVKSLINFAKDYTSFSYHLLEGGIPGISISDDPGGETISLDELLDLYEKLDSIEEEAEDESDEEGNDDNSDILIEDLKYDLETPIINFPESVIDDSEVMEPLEYED